MKKVSTKAIILVLAVIISTVDFFNSGNGGLQLLLAFLSSCVVFYMPHLSIKFKKIPFTILLLANAAFLVLAYRRGVLLINILILSYLIWSIITPVFLRHKLFLPITFLIAFTTVYAGAFLQFSTPLFIIVFYPLYVLGAITNEHNILKKKKVWTFGIFNLLLSSLLLIIFMYKSLGKSILGSLLFLNIEKLGTVTAVYLPFLAVFMVWFASSFNFLLYMAFSRFKAGKKTFALTHYMRPVHDFISFLIFTALISFACEFSIRLDLSATINDFMEPNVLFNIVFLCGIYLCFISLLGKGISNILIVFFGVFLTIANFIKFTYFDEPFYPWDIYLIRNLIGISKDYLNIPVIASASLVIFLAVFLLIRFRKNVGQYLKPRFSLILLLFGIALTLLNINVLMDTSLSSQVGIEKSWYIGKSEIMSNGMFAQNFFYLKDLKKYLNPKPEDYSKEEMLAINKKYEKAVNASVTLSKSNTVEKPNIVVIMSESYWDLTKLNGINFSKNITENVYKYQKGELAPPAIGGGTANTEFEALTGMSLYFMSPGIIAYNAYLRTETPSIVSVFKNNGYNTTAIHPNSGWFYNRDKVYGYFGFDTFLDVSSFDVKTQAKGTHISDDALTDKVLDTLNSSDKPSFIFAVSMENHDPFNNKYDSYDVTIESDKLSSSEKEIVNGYAQGLYDADQSLGKLINSLSKSKKPTLLYFFGDHAPRLGTLDDYYKIYDKLGTKENLKIEQGLGELKYYTTPLVAWSNYKEMRTYSSVISPSHISYEILKDSGVNYPNYFNILPELEATFPILHLKNMDKVDANNELIKDYRSIQYDMLFGKKYLRDMAD